LKFFVRQINVHSLVSDKRIQPQNAHEVESFFNTHRDTH